MGGGAKKTLETMNILQLGKQLPATSAQQAVGHAGAPTSEDAVRLAAKLRAHAAEHDRIFMFADIADRTGAAESAWQVAQALAQSSPGEVLFVDADLRTPAVHRHCHIPLTPGLAESIRLGIPDPAAIHVSRSLSVMAAGVDPDTTGLFSSAEFEAILDGWTRQYRWIVLAGPPVLEGADACLLAARSHGVVLIATAGKNRKRELLAAKRDLDSLRTPVLGVILYQE